MDLTVIPQVKPDATKILKPYLYSIVFTNDLEKTNGLQSELSTFL